MGVEVWDERCLPLATVLSVGKHLSRDGRSVVPGLIR